jgi:hypothetical protein
MKTYIKLGGLLALLAALGAAQLRGITDEKTLKDYNIQLENLILKGLKENPEALYAYDLPEGAVRLVVFGADLGAINNKAYRTGLMKRLIGSLPKELLSLSEFYRTGKDLTEYLQSIDEFLLLKRLAKEHGCTKALEHLDTIASADWKKAVEKKEKELAQSNLDYQLASEAAASRGAQKADALIKQGANVNALVEFIGGLFGIQTPLQIACYNGNLDVATLLIESGADINARNNPKKGTPLSIVRERVDNYKPDSDYGKKIYDNMKQIQKFLKNKGASEYSHA